MLVNYCYQNFSNRWQIIKLSDGSGFERAVPPGEKICFFYANSTDAQVEVYDYKFATMILTARFSLA
jgi:hypothetical protein